MKKIIKYSLIASLSVVALSCTREDFDIAPTHQDIPSTLFTTKDGFRNTLDGAYDGIKGMFTDDTGNAVIVADVLADNLVMNPSGRLSNKDAYEWSYAPTSGSVTTIFYEAYRVISRANLILDNIDKLPSDDFMKNIEAEAKAIRGIMHFEVARAYAKIPTQSADANNSLGIPYITTFDPKQKPQRDGKVSESYAKIIADLEFAYANIKADNNDGRFNKTSVAAALNEVYLYMGNFDKAAQYGEVVIAASPSVGLRDNFAGIWDDSSKDGVLLKLLNANAAYDNGNVGVAYNQNSGGIKSEYNVDYELYSLYSNDDIRKSAYFITSPFAGKSYNHIVKYRTRAGSTVAGVVDPKYIRTAEVYLNTAEAHTKKSASNEARALQLLNSLRKERYANYVNGTETGTALFTAIMLERRLELAFENDRFWTLKRLGLGVTRSAFGPESNGGGAPRPASIMNLPANSQKWLLPFPQTEINTNPNMVQNPGY